MASGPEAVSLRAIAREMGMTAPGLYRYFGSHEELRQARVRQHLHRAGRGHPPGHQAADAGAARPDRKTENLTIKMVAACREFRRWALDHKAEFALLFGVPLPGLDDGRYDTADECALAFAGTFFTLFLELWAAVPFPVPAAEEIDPGLRDQLMRYRDALGADIPVGAVLTFLRCWTVLYGAVAMEVFGHMRFALEDAAPMFEITLGDLASLVGLRYPLPAVGRRSAASDATAPRARRGQHLRGCARPAASRWMRPWNLSTADGKRRPAEE